MRRVFGRAFAILVTLLALAGPGSARAAHDIYRIDGIPVDATAENAVAARDAAIEQGEREGLRLLLQRLTLPGDSAGVPPADRSELDRAVRSFEVAEEQVGATRYVGKLNVSFNRPEVERLLRNAGIAFVPDPPEPVLLVPVVRAEGRLSLWGDDDPWRAAWAAAPPRGLLEVVLPVGDGDDLVGLTPQAIEGGDGPALQQMVERYQVGAGFVATAMLPVDGVVEGTQVRFDLRGEDLRPVFSETVPAGPGATEVERLAPVVERAQSALDLVWKRQNMDELNRVTVLAVEVPLADLRSWVQIRQGVEGLKPVRRLRIDSIDRARAEVIIEYTGDFADLERAIAGLGLGLAEETDGWRLLPAGELGGTVEQLPEPATSL